MAFGTFNKKMKNCEQNKPKRINKPKERIGIYKF